MLVAAMAFALQKQEKKKEGRIDWGGDHSEVAKARPIAQGDFVRVGVVGIASSADKRSRQRASRRFALLQHSRPCSPCCFAKTNTRAMTTPRST